MHRHPYLCAGMVQYALTGYCTLRAQLYLFTGLSGDISRATRSLICSSLSVPLVPKRVIEALARKKGDPTNPLGKLAAEHHGGGEA